MNTDGSQPSVAPKPRCVCHASLQPPSPLMSAGRGPKPSVAPKPRITFELNGRNAFSPSNCIIGNTLAQRESNEKPSDFLNQVIKREPLFHLKSPADKSEGLADVSMTAEEKEEEEHGHGKVDEIGRLSDSNQTEELDSMETLWHSDAGLTTDSDEGVEMINIRITDNIDHDAGEALADTEGLAVGDASISSLDEEPAGRCDSKGDEHGTSQVTWRMQDKEVDAPIVVRDQEDKEATLDCGFSCNILKLTCGPKKVEDKSTRFTTDEPNIPVCNFTSGDQKFPNPSERHPLLQDGGHDLASKEMIQEDPQDGTPPWYLCGRNNPVKDSKCNSARNGPANCLNSDDYVEIQNNICNSKKDNSLMRSDGHKEGRLSSAPYSQPRFRLLYNPAPMETESSLSPSPSDNHLASLSDSDFLSSEDDLDGFIGRFMDECTETQPEFSTAQRYQSSEQGLKSDTVFVLNKRPAGVSSRSWSQLRMNNVNQINPNVSPRPCWSGPKGPALNAARRDSKQHLSMYPRSFSMEEQKLPLHVHRDGGHSPIHTGAFYSSGRFSKCSSGLSTPTSAVDIPPPFQLAYITKKPITKSSPSLLMESDSSEKNRKKASSIKRFLMLKFRRKAECKPDVNHGAGKASTPPSHHPPKRFMDLDSPHGSPLLYSRPVSKSRTPSELTPNFLFYHESRCEANSEAFLNRSVIRVESFNDRSRVPFMPLPLTKPRSISFPNTDTSDYENVPPLSADYENIQVPARRPVRQEPIRVLSSANETDGYVDMSSLPGFHSKTKPSYEEPESAYTEAYKVCAAAAASLKDSPGDAGRRTAAEDDPGRTSEEDDGGAECICDSQHDGRTRAFYIAKELADSEKQHVKALKRLQEDFREAVGAAVGDEGEPVLEDERLWEILNELPDVYTLHRRLLTELENRIRHWDERQRIADIFLSRKLEFLVFTTYIGHYDRSVSLLEESCRRSSAFAAVVQRFEKSPAGETVSLQQQLLQVIVRVAQYRMLLTDYLNNLSPDSQEYEDTQAAVVIVSDIADQVNDSLQHGENLLRLVTIAYSVGGQRGLLQPGRVFVKEGTLMKVSRKRPQPRHLFLMNDVLLYTFPQQDGKYRLKETLTLAQMKVSKPVVENVQNALRIEAAGITVTLAASSFLEREDWFYTLSRTVAEQARGASPVDGCSAEARDCMKLALGEKAPTLVPVSQVMMCMNCTSDFSLTLRRHHCHGCGRIVCRSCSRNRYPLKYMKDRMAKVCDHCYGELKKRGDDDSANSAKSSPRTPRASRPLSVMFQNIHPPNIWRHRKGMLTFTQVTVSDEGSISGNLHRSKKRKKSWKRFWFLLKDKVLYTYRGQEEKIASETLPLLGFTVRLPDQREGDLEANVFQLYHKNTLYYTFKAEDNYTAQRWANAMEEATVL
ncbi:FYVE, RhoGEF and PH domain-containing protein 5-like isoform X1 [Synchiropus splendidus]|uniref:FYVE, RhoGEF and PH domain-containing protein 5-like isoform X1 n=1 Tax=Synchiropus splendidus TaxID=270530 RepID=UPI00237DD406|nr:FYVE, RhoGEF and PH domain-containing protein 5-like isoform X1 [Synchiropus splendidus]